MTRAVTRSNAEKTASVTCCSFAKTAMTTINNPSDPIETATIRAGSREATAAGGRSA